MNVVITRDTKESSKMVHIWPTDDLEKLELMGDGVFYPKDEKAIDGWPISFVARKFERFFGFIPERGTKEVYSLNLERIVNV